MTLLGRDQPDLPPDTMFSDFEIKVLRAFAEHRRRPAPDTLPSPCAWSHSSAATSTDRAARPPAQGSCGRAAPPSSKCASDIDWP